MPLIQLRISPIACAILFRYSFLAHCHEDASNPHKSMPFTEGENVIYNVLLLRNVTIAHQSVGNSLHSTACLLKQKVFAHIHR